MAVQFTCREACNLNRNKLYSLYFLRTYSNKKSLKKWNKDDSGKSTTNQNLDFDKDYLETRGYLRLQKPYFPPEDVENIISGICQKHSDLQNGILGEALAKFKILKECSETLNHTVPNSLLHKIKTIDDLCVFYQTEVNVKVPLDQMNDIDLPKNLHVLHNYTRFHPETDTMFGGISAYPENSTLMSDLRRKKKYAGFIAKKKSL